MMGRALEQLRLLKGKLKREPRPEAEVFGVLGQFEGEKELLAAIHRARDLGYTKLEAYTPLPLHEVCHALGHKNRLPMIVLIGGIIGAFTGFFLQYYASVIDYPLNVGGRPLNSWPSFIVVTFEMTILFAAFSAVLGMLALNGLPRPHHPVFAIKEFEQASASSFFLHVLGYDPIFDRETARQILEDSGSFFITEVPN